MGATCFVISTSKYYMLTSDYKWVQITPFGQPINSSGGGNNGDSPSGDIVYEGGLI
jgi:hypothetical protein